MENSSLAELGNLFLALSDKTRLRLLALMAAGEVSVGFLAESLGESQPKISRHLAYLRSAGLVSTRRDGKWIYYSIAGQADRSAESVLRSTLNVITGRKSERPLENGPTQPPPTNKNLIYDETDMADWRPAEIDVFLL